MTRRLRAPFRRAALALLAFVTTLGAAQAAPTELRALLERQADVVAVTPGPRRIVLPAEVQAQTRADRADLRLLDTSGRSVPFELFAPPRAPTFTSGTVPRLADVERSFDEERRPLGEILVYELDEPARFDAVDVPLGTGGSLVARVDVSVEAPGGAWRQVVADAPLFRVSGWESAPASSSRIELPRATARRVRLEVRIQQGSWVAPTRLTLLTRRERPIPVDRWPLETIDTERTAAGSRLRLALPPGLDLRALELETTTERFLRPVRVLTAAGEELARGVVARVRDANGETRERLRIELDDPPAGELLLEVEDVGEPPLADVVVMAESAAPTLVFVAPGDTELTLYWKGHRLLRAAHGRGATLAELMGVGEAGPAPDEDAVLAWVDGLPESRLGPPRANPRFEPEPQLFAEVRPGAAVDPAGWSHRALLELQPSEAGIAAWTLSLESEALLARDHRDLRIVDDRDRQIPYVLEEAPERRVPVELRRLESDPGTTRLEVVLPAVPVAVHALELEIADRFVDRESRLHGRVEGDDTDRRFGRGTLERRGGGEDLRLPLSGGAGYRVERLELEIDDGDDAPLGITRAWIATRATRVVVAGPPGTHHLLLGAPAVEAPRYELRSASELITALPAGDAVAAPIGANPAHRDPGWWRSFEAETAAIWAVIAVAVVALVAMSLRLARSPDADTPSGDGG